MLAARFYRRLAPIVFVSACLIVGGNALLTYLDHREKSTVKKSDNTDEQPEINYHEDYSVDKLNSQVAIKQLRKAVINNIPEPIEAEKPLASAPSREELVVQIENVNQQLEQLRSSNR
ncbi:hypothetical protein LRP49_02280 [Enterovibrio sp. ZSDZ35]|uniref:Uncharacterized protein n=1 Tax=Enterovibrio qingdaonensis TaxID=2899818 RepID=A0ABT5QHP6_9GAMM|nr:hypothetical protein [Enterovibrio sp. ZSDZ35]MDD1780015.1 hypothetical protein [Enterovibrio sp. ZSDZ35]